MVFASSALAQDFGVILNDAYAGEGTPVVATDGSGNWVVLYSMPRDFGGTLGDRDIFGARSPDDGATWTDPIVVNSTATTDGSATDTDPDIAASCSRRSTRLG